MKNVRREVRPSFLFHRCSLWIARTRTSRRNFADWAKPGKQKRPQWAKDRLLPECIIRRLRRNRSRQKPSRRNARDFWFRRTGQKRAASRVPSLKSAHPDSEISGFHGNSTSSDGRLQGRGLRIFPALRANLKRLSKRLCKRGVGSPGKWRELEDVFRCAFADTSDSGTSGAMPAADSDLFLLSWMRRCDQHGRVLPAGLLSA